MSTDSKIEWTDATWNPVTGCTKVSPGCDHCYAETFAERWRGIPGHHFEKGFDVTLRPERLDQPYRWRKPRRVFVNSMSDLFHDAVPDLFIEEVFEVMEGCPQHTFQVLTKRHARMRSFVRARQKRKEDYALAFENNPIPARRTCPAAAFARKRADNPPANIWLGVSAEDQKWADIRIPALVDTPAAVRFVSAEPLLGPLNLTPWLPRLSWMIAGGESGPGARPMDEDWVRAITWHCRAMAVPVFVKQMGSVLGRQMGAGSKGGDWDAWPEDLKVRQFPRTTEAVTA
jgi:protein gp37